MIGSSFRLVFFGALGLGISWAGFFLVPGIPRQIAGWDDAWYVASFPRGSHPVDPGSGTRWPWLEPLLAAFPDAREHAGVLIARHGRTSWGLAPFWAAALAISIFGGAILRERLHRGTAYASPSASLISKRIWETAGLAYVLWSVAPLPFPYWFVYPLLGLVALATLGYVANLPLRL